MNPKTFEEAIDIVVSEMRDLLVRKNHDYGSDNLKSWGDLGIAVRLNDKVARLRNIYTKGKQKVLDESLDDTYRDIANYGILALMLRKGWLDLPHQETLPTRTVKTQPLNIVVDEQGPVTIIKSEIELMEERLDKYRELVKE